MTSKRLTLPIDAQCHVDEVVRVCSCCHDPEFAHTPRLVTLGDQFREPELIASIRVDGANRGLAGREMVRVTREQPIKVALRRLAHHALRAHLSNHSSQVFAEREGHLEIPIGVTKEHQIRDADFFRGRRLFGLADTGDLRSTDGWVETAGVAVGYEAVGDLDAPVGPGCDRGGRSEVDIVWMRRHNERPLHLIIWHRHTRQTRGVPFNFSDLDVSQLQRRTGVKWSKYGPDVLPAWVADMDFPLAPVIVEALTSAVVDGDVGYPGDGSDIGIRFAERAERRWGWSVDPSRVRLMPDVVKSIELILKLFTRPGDGILVNTPIYPPFLKRTRVAERVVVENPLATDGGLDLDHLATVLAEQRPRVILLCNPHNPTGRVLRRSELIALAELAVAHDVLVVSDEIHAELIYPDSPAHTPIASLGSEIASRTLTLTSTSKPFNLAGLRCALIVAGSDELDAPIAHHQDVEKDPFGSLGLTATRAAWTPEGDAWLAGLIQVLDQNRRRIGAWAREAGVGYRSPEATYLAWLDLRGYPGLGDNPSNWLLDNAKVGLSQGPDFGELGHGFSRLNFATSPAILDQILSRISEALPS